MHRECDVCKDKRLEFAAFDPMKETRWYEWQMVDCERKNKNTGETESNREDQVRTKRPWHREVFDKTELA
ncbi:hypothetical protein LSAT2_019408 [Lamellibrachia satsuma]|nr:hypothetical protein LSAT2_019408 [Lamellibrachia satsuma]